MPKITFEAKLDNGYIKLIKERYEFEDYYILELTDNDGITHTVTTTDVEIIDLLADFIKNN